MSNNHPTNAKKPDIQITNYADQSQAKREAAFFVAASGCPICLTCSCTSILAAAIGLIPGGGGNQQASASVFG